MKLERENLLGSVCEMNEIHTVLFTVHCPDLCPLLAVVQHDLIILTRKNAILKEDSIVNEQKQNLPARNQQFPAW